VAGICAAVREANARLPPVPAPLAADRAAGQKAIRFTTLAD
jgi:hypothetical protein